MIAVCPVVFYVVHFEAAVGWYTGDWLAHEDLTIVSG